MARSSQEQTHPLAFDPGQGLAGVHWPRCRRPAAALSAEQLEMDEALEAIYASESATRRSAAASGNRPPKAARMARSRGARCRASRAGSIRSAISSPRTSSSLLQQDAIERRGMKELLFEPEIMAKVEPSIDLASAVL